MHVPGRSCRRCIRMNTLRSLFYVYQVCTTHHKLIDTISMIFRWRDTQERGYIISFRTGETLVAQAMNLASQNCRCRLISKNV
jgi:hypothetical protein